MKKILFILFSVFVFASISNHANAQDVGFGNDNNPGSNSLKGTIHCTQAATVTFELRVYAGSNSEYGSANCWIRGYGYFYVSAPKGQQASKFFTISLPAGYTDVEIFADKSSSVVLFATAINGRSHSTRPMVFTAR